MRGTLLILFFAWLSIAHAFAQPVCPFTPSQTASNTQCANTAFVQKVIAGQPLATQVPNAASTGTTLNKLAKLTGAPSTAVITATTDTSGILGIVTAGAGTTGNATIALTGQASCVFDGATTAGHYVQNSSSVAGDCHDAGASLPSSGQVLGVVLSTNAAGGTYPVVLFGPGIVESSISVSVIAGNGLSETGTCSGSSLNCTLAAIGQPMGRLTLVSGTPVMTANETAQATLFYDCYKGGNRVPVYNGTIDVVLTIGACEISDALQSSGTGVVNNAGVFDEWAVSVSGTLTLCHATNGSGGGWASDTGGSNTARGTGYSQLDTSTRPYITNKNAITHCYNGTTDEGSIAANQASYLGSFFTTAAGQTGMNYKPAGAAGGAAPVLGLFNAYNQVETCSFNKDTQSHTYATVTWRAANNSANNSISWVDGLQMSSIRAIYATTWLNGASTAGARIGINLNATTGAPISFAQVIESTTSLTRSLTAAETFLPQLGFNFVQEMEEATNTNSSTFNADSESFTACLLM